MEPATADAPAPGPPPTRGLYVHVPFCETKCSYCDFYSLPGGTRGREPERYLDALARELERRAPPGFAPETVFVGGGTPTALEAPALARLGRIVRDSVDLSRLGEWTVEANPGTLGPDKVEALLGAGVDRVSMGVQSFDDRVLRSVGRIHTAEEARAAVRDLRAAGLRRLSVDLLFAVPGQGMETFARDLEEAVALGTTHLSCYALLYEEGTAMASREARGLVRREEEERERAMLLLARDRLAAAGLPAYETSNFARPGEECRHNLVYWRNLGYLGVGVSAASFLDGERRSNVRDLRTYVERVEAGEDPVAESERLGPRAALGETVMLGLRLAEGVRLSALAARTGLDAGAEVGGLVRRLAAGGLLEFDGDRFALTREGLCVGDAVAAEFLEPAAA